MEAEPLPTAMALPNNGGKKAVTYLTDKEIKAQRDDQYTPKVIVIVSSPGLRVNLLWLQMRKPKAVLLLTDSKTGNHVSTGAV